MANWKEVIERWLPIVEKMEDKGTMMTKGPTDYSPKGIYLQNEQHVHEWFFPDFDNSAYAHCVRCPAVLEPKEIAIRLNEYEAKETNDVY